MKSRVLARDLENISKRVCFQEFDNSTVLVTGATGLIGSLLVKTLIFCSRKYKLNIKVVACVRSVEKADRIFGDMEDSANLEYCVSDLLSGEINYDKAVDYIIHTAAITNSQMMVKFPVDTAMVAINGTNKVLEFGAAHKVKSVVYISSMEVYGEINQTNKISEETLGYIDITKPRSSYPESKRMCECLCAAYAEQYDLNVKVVRLAQTFGAGISKEENRVFAQFARSVINMENIVLHTHGQSEGNYVYTADAVAAILLVLLHGKKAEIYNVSNEESHMKICEMAEMAAKELADGKIKVVYDIPEDSKAYGYAPETHLWMDSSKMKSLGWEAQVSLKESYVRTMEWMEDIGMVRKTR